MIAITERRNRMTFQPRPQMPAQMRGLLGRHLRGRGQGTFAVCRHERRAVADGENALVLCGLHRRAHQNLVRVIGVEPADALQEVGCLDASGPHEQIARDQLAVVTIKAVAVGAHDARIGQHAKAQALKLRLGGRRNLWRKGAQHARAAFYECEFQTFANLRIAVGRGHFEHAAKFSRQFHARGAAARDHDTQRVVVHGAA